MSLSSMLGHHAWRSTVTTCVRFAAVAAIASLVAPPVTAADPADWAFWLGPEGNRISRDLNLVDTWSPKGENVIWSEEDYATRCTPIVMNGKLYVVARYMPETKKEGERLICVDANTGEKLWEKSHNVFLSDAPAERVGWSSVVGDPETGNVFWLGLGCEFACLNGETGETLWDHSMSEEYGMLSTYGGRTNFPIVFDDLVIVSGVMTQWGEFAPPAHRFVGFDKRTGAAVWFSGTTPKPKDTTYSTPVLTTFDGQAAMVFGSGDGMIHAMQPRTGKIIWSYQASNRGINTTPAIVGNTVICGFHEQSSADTRILGGFFAIDGTSTGTVKEEDLLWKIKGEQINGGQPLILDGRVYVVDLFGKLIVADVETGEVIFERKVGRRPGSLIYADGKIYCAESTGNFWVFKATEEGVEEIERVRLNRQEILADPIIWNSKIYLTTSEAMFCIGNTDAEIAADTLPAAPTETPVAEDTELAHIQLAPVEAILAPGQSTPYQVRGYNKNGQFLKVIDDATFEVEGGGTTTDGTYTAPEGTEHKAVSITAKVGELTSKARARVIPKLPWKFDFNDNQVPITWIGANYRHQPKVVDGEPVLVKVSTIPLGTRSQGWMGWPTFHDYTIQADVYSTQNASTGDKADMGLINQRYTLDLMGKDELQIRSWTPRLELRFAKTIPFAWEVNTWYTLKFQSENQDGRVVLRGKAWKRGEEEPTEWSIEAADETPNVVGSPGLFGKSTNAEFYIDNVEVYK